MYLYSLNRKSNGHDATRTCLGCYNNDLRSVSRFIPIELITHGPNLRISNEIASLLCAVTFSSKFSQLSNLNKLATEILCHLYT